MDPWSSSLYSYTIKQIFIHIDDPNQQVQQAIVKVLEKAAYDMICLALDTRH